MVNVAWSRYRIAIVLSGLAMHAGVAHGAANTTTYHYDNLPTGWNQAETALDAANAALARGDYANAIRIAKSVLHPKSNPAMSGEDR